jgi:hypothetical protein
MICLEIIKLRNPSINIFDFTTAFHANVSHTLDQIEDIIKYSLDTFSRIAMEKYGEHTGNFLSFKESHGHIGIVVLSVTAPICVFIFSVTDMTVFF